jgi:small conductance mechanosensitive channel
MVRPLLIALACALFVSTTAFAQEGNQPTADSVTVSSVEAPSASAAADSLRDAIGRLSSDVQEVGRDIASGDFRQLKFRAQDFMESLIVNFLPRMIGALIVLVLLLIVYKLVEMGLNRTLRRTRSVDSGLEHILLRTYRVVALTFIAVLVLSQFGINVAALLAGLSIVGVAVGFAAQDTVQNYIAGITIMIDKPFRVGDNIMVDGIFGTVVKITLRSTRVQTQNREILVMPNVMMINQKLINHTALPVLRVEVLFGIAYKEFPDEARKVVLAITEGDPRLDPTRPAEVVVTQMNNSSVDMSLRLFISDPREEVAVRLDYTERVREALREADIEIPFPHLQLFVDEAKAFEDSAIMQRQLPPKKG